MVKYDDDKIIVPVNSHSDNEEIRKYLIDKTLETIEYMSEKVYKGRVRNPKNEQIRINQLKTIINACNVGNRILKDAQYDMLLKEVKELKNELIYNSQSDDIIEITPEQIKKIENLDDEIIKLEENEWRG